MSKYETMFATKASTNNEIPGLGFSYSDFGLPSDFGFRFSDFQRFPRRGFSFVEVLFAVIILGVGFIMIAALFPVAIRQTKNTADENAAASIARAGANYIGENATSANMPSDGSLVSPGTMIGIPTYSNTTPNTNYTFWQQIRGNVISQDDPRYAYVSMYFRGGDVNSLTNTWTAHPYAQVVTICVQATEAPTFTTADYYNKTTDTAAVRVNLQPRPVQIQIVNGANGDVDLIGIQDSTTDVFAGASAAAAEGAFVVMRTDPTNSGALIGSIYRIGARRPEMDKQSVQSYTSTGGSVGVTFGANQTVWELMPGNDFAPTAKSGTNPAIESPTTMSEAWIVGRSFADPTNPAGVFAGPAMDVSAYSTFVAVH